MQSISTARIKLILEKLKSLRNRSSTNKIYYTIWKKFNKFVLCLDVRPASWEERMSLYGAHLVDRGVQSATLRSYTSVIKCILTTDGYRWNDDAVLLHTLTRACNDRVMTRLPIRIGLLEIILFELERIFENQWYCEMLYKTLFILAYYGLFRIGELTYGDHTIKAKDVHVGTNKDKILFVLYSSKTHGKESSPQEVKISAVNGSDFTKRNRNFCLFVLAGKHMQMRGEYESDSEPFFVCSDGSAVTAVQVHNILRQTLVTLNINPWLYNTHSFCAGRSCDLMKMGFAIEQIKDIGLWKSNAVYKYLK